MNLIITVYFLTQALTLLPSAYTSINLYLYLCKWQYKVRKRSILLLFGIIHLAGQRSLCTKNVSAQGFYFLNMAEILACKQHCITSRLFPDVPEHIQHRLSSLRKGLYVLYRMIEGFESYDWCS